MSTQKLVIVTGASRGIGFEISRRLLAAGFSVHMIARHEKGLETASKMLKKYGNVTYSAVDLSSREAILSFTSGWNKKIWGLVNNAGRWAEERIDEPDRDIWDPIMKLNVEGTYFLTKQLQRWITKDGRIVNIASQLGTTGRAGMGAYSASKHAVIGLTRCWALELGSKSITVNAVCPGWINTESNRREICQWAKDLNMSFAQKLRDVSEPLTLKRFIEPKEVASLVSFLVGEEGSGVTGQVYEIK